MPNTNIHVTRLKPGDDLKKSIQELVITSKCKAGWIVTTVGSLSDYTIRFANQSKAGTGSGYFEIVGLTGTVSVNGSHLHLIISDSTGNTIGGHLMEGCIIYTTAEIVIQYSDDLIFERKNDGTTGWNELHIKKNDDVKLDE